MNLKIWHRLRGWQLPVQVRAGLVSQLNVGLEEMDKLSCVSKEGILHGRPVRFIRVFDPIYIPGGAAAVTDYDQLGVQFQEALLFEGHIERNGSLYLVDRRQPGRTNFLFRVQPAL